MDNTNSSNLKFQDFKKQFRYENEDQQKIFEKMLNILDTYEKNNSKENHEYLCYLTAAIYLTYRKLFPQLTIYIPFRTKGDLSFIKNIQKEFSLYIHDLSNTDPFDVTSIVKDISGLKIILDDINTSRPAQGESELLLSDPDIQKLSPDYKQNPDDISHNEFITQVYKYLSSPIKDGKEYYKLKRDLLKRIIEVTPPEFTKERDPKPSFARLYEDAKHQFDYFLANDNFPSKIQENELIELKDLLDDFRSRSSDKYHFAILRKTLPIVLEDPLIKNALMASYSFEKETKKPIGFQASYYKLETPFGLIEIQCQSNKANYAATKGSAYHSKIQGKFINIKNFFELVDPNDKHDLSYYLDKLDTVSADELVSPFEIPHFKSESERIAFFTSPKGKKFIESEKYREMMKHIRIKSQIKFLPERLPVEAYDIDAKDLPSDVYKEVCHDNGSIDLKRLQELVNTNQFILHEENLNKDKLQKLIDSGQLVLDSINANDFLLSTAIALSPYMNVCSSSHTSFTSAEIHHKKVIDEFTEVLRRKDSNTCLRSMLINRLEMLIENDGVLDESIEKNSNISKNRLYSLQVIKKREKTSSKLPKDISRKDILDYSGKLRSIDLER